MVSLTGCGDRKKTEETSQEELNRSDEVTMARQLETSSDGQRGASSTFSPAKPRVPVPETAEGIREAIDAIPAENVIGKIEEGSEMLSAAAVDFPEQVKLVAEDLFNQIYSVKGVYNPNTGYEEVPITQETLDSMVDVVSAVGSIDPEWAEQVIDSAPGDMKDPILEGLLVKQLREKPQALNELVMGFDDYRVKSQYHLAKVALANGGYEGALSAMQTGFQMTPEHAEIYVNRVLEHLETTQNQ